MRWVKFIKWTFIILGVLVVVAIGGLYYLFSSMCANQVLSETTSPDGKYKAIVFERDCGASTDFSTQVSIIPSHSSIGNTSGNLFSVDSNHGASTPGPGGGPDVKVYWRSPEELVVSYHLSARVFLKKEKILSIKVTYEPLPH